MAIKENLYSFCENYVEDRLKRIKQNIQEIKEFGKSDEHRISFKLKALEEKPKEKLLF